MWVISGAANIILGFMSTLYELKRKEHVLIACLCQASCWLFHIVGSLATTERVWRRSLPLSIAVWDTAPKLTGLNNRFSSFSLSLPSWPDSAMGDAVAETVAMEWVSTGNAYPSPTSKIGAGCRRAQMEPTTRCPCVVSGCGMGFSRPMGSLWTHDVWVWRDLVPRVRTLWEKSRSSWAE